MRRRIGGFGLIRIGIALSGGGHRATAFGLGFLNSQKRADRLIKILDDACRRHIEVELFIPKLDRMIGDGMVKDVAPAPLELADFELNYKDSPNLFKQARQQGFRCYAQ